MSTLLSAVRDIFIIDREGFSCKIYYTAWLRHFNYLLHEAKMKYILSFIAAFIPLMLLSGCEMNRLDNAEKELYLKQEAAGIPVIISVVKGPKFTDRMKAGPLTFNVLPQIAVWAEDGNGKLIDTLYVTGADWKKMRHAGKKKLGADFYSQCFPLWASRVKAAGKELPAPKKPYTDAVTSATPMSSFKVHTRLNTGAEPVYIYAEINKSGDNNTAYTKDNNDWAGQPSLLYRAEVNNTAKGQPVKLELIGHSGMIKEAPAVHSDTSGLDSALDIIREITVIFN